jgi:phosphoribosyl-AMP cyclohydrolase
MSQIPDFTKGDGLLPVIAQDVASGAVLMLGYMNREAWEQTLATGAAVYYSRSRKRLWKKGEESGNIQRVQAVYVDCDADTILLQVEQIGGAACHEGYPTCFFRRWNGADFVVEGERVFNPRDVYDKPSH